MEKEIVEEEIDLREYLDVIWKNRLLILALLLASLIASGYYSFFILRDEYQTDAVIYLKKLPEDINTESYSYPTVIIPSMTSSEVISKTVEQSGLSDAFKDSKMPKESAASWLKENIRITQNKNNINNLVSLQLRGSLEPGTLQKTLNTYIEVVKAENKKTLTKEVEGEKERIGLINSYLIEQRAKILLAIEKTLGDNSSNRVVMLENFIDQSSRLNAIDIRLDALQITRMNLEFIESPDFDMIEVISSPNMPDKVGPSRVMNIVIAGILGLFIGIIAAFFKNYVEGSQSG